MERGAVDAKRVKRSTPLEPRCAMYKKDRYKGWEEGARAVGIDGMGWRIGAGGLPCSFCSGGRVEMTHGWVAVGSRFSESLERTRGKWKAAVNSYSSEYTSWQIRGMGAEGGG